VLRHEYGFEDTGYLPCVPVLGREYDMARIKLVPTEKLTPGMQRIAKAAEAHKLNPRIFQAAGNLPGAYEAFWHFYGPLKLEGLLDARLKELVRLKIAELNECAT
jgi:alkylhydroperoxidase family enzyme